MALSFHPEIQVTIIGTMTGTSPTTLSTLVVHYCLLKTDRIITAPTVIRLFRDAFDTQESMVKKTIH